MGSKGVTDMRRSLKPFILVVTGLLWTSTAQAQTADEVVEKHLAAVGGRAVLAKATSQVATGTMVVSTQGMDLSGPVEIYRKAPNKARSFIRLDLSAVGGTELTVDQRCDGKTGFASNSMQGDREITGDQLQAMLNNTFPSSLLNYKEAGGKVELTGKDKVGDRAVHVLLYTPMAGPASRMFIDAETYDVLRTVTKINVPEAGGEVEQTIDVGDFRTVSGMRLPFRVTTVNTTQTVSITLAKIEINVPIDDAMFARPGVK
jgi:outer membrane lipoprotein-sorting protein